jgi:hypothetical protein
MKLLLLAAMALCTYTAPAKSEYRFVLAEDNKIYVETCYTHTDRLGVTTERWVDVDDWFADHVRQDKLTELITAGDSMSIELARELLKHEIGNRY